MNASCHVPPRSSREARRCRNSRAIESFWQYNEGWTPPTEYSIYSCVKPSLDLSDHAASLPQRDECSTELLDDY